MPLVMDLIFEIGFLWPEIKIGNGVERQSNKASSSFLMIIIYKIRNSIIENPVVYISRIWLLLHFISIFSSMCYATWATIPLGDFPSSLSQGKSSIIFLWLLSNRGATNHKMDGLNTLLRLLLLCFQQLEFYGK